MEFVHKINRFDICRRKMGHHIDYKGVGDIRKVLASNLFMFFKKKIHLKAFRTQFKKDYDVLRESQFDIGPFSRLTAFTFK